MKKAILILLPALLFMSSCDRGIDIVSNGRSLYTVIIPAEPKKSDSTAAIYLTRYIREMSGADIPVLSDTATAGSYEICIGNTNRGSKVYDSLAPDACRILTEGRKVFIAGGSHKGTVYGVIDLLEGWGCRRFSPEEVFIPHKRSLSLQPDDRIKAPANTLRIINGVMTNDPEYADWLRISTNREVFPPGYFVHTFERLIPREDYFDAHPEYFAWLGNKYSHDQPCPSNPMVRELIIEKLDREMLANPSGDLWSVSQNDNFTYCRCDECLAIIREENSPAGPVIRLVNDVAATFPGKTITTLAYQFSRTAPSMTRPAENVMVMLCTIELNRSKPIKDDSLSRSFVTDITEWGKICSNIYLWDYTINFNHCISPFPNLHVLQPNMQFFYENNVRKHFPQSNLQKGHEFAELKGKLLSALLWDPYVDLDSVKNDFLVNYYGKAAPFIGEYIDRRESELIRSGKILYIYEPPNNHSDGFLSAANVVAYHDLFDKAEGAVAGEQEMLNRVKIARLPLQYAIMEIGKNDMFGPRGWYEETGEGFILRKEMKQTLESFYQVCTTNNISSMNEKNLSVEAYYHGSLRFIDVQVEGNLAFRKPVSVSPPAEAKYAGGDPKVLTDGVQGAHDFNVHWLGWWGRDAMITVDMEQLCSPEKIEIGTLWDGRSWILHPATVSCSVSVDGETYSLLGTQRVSGDQQDEPLTRKFSFYNIPGEIRYVRFEIIGAGPLPRWHASEGEPSWFFVDEVTVF